ncbi:rhodanese-like domain-containing protein [Bacillus alkalicola]|uniref:Rhodanese-like domain-containing protein n=1 Tax=Evansella alkalicola TaxID=745819 RepID=A0ABS6JWY7_9BACI|nr:rhodanese-like domain-containing protein [Bacillus alkalicola]
MKKNIIYVIPLLFLLAIFGFQSISALGTEEITTSELGDLLDQPNDYFFVDVREVHEYNEAHINGMVNVPLSTLNSDYHNIPKDRTAVIFCRSGNRSLQAIKILEDLGYENLINVKGGMLAWEGEVVN